MAKITDKNYFLPDVYAINGIEVLSSGTTQPMLIRGLCKKTNEKSDYVVKFIGAPRMSTKSSCNELVAALIGLELDLNVAEPVLIDISADFVDSLRGRDGFKYASNSLGINIGCKYIPGVWKFTSQQQLNEVLYNEAGHIFSFDVFISNSDRRLDNSNMLTNGDKIFIFDHELAFGFVMDIIKNPTPWIITDHDLGWIKKHYFYPILKNNEHSFDAFFNRFEVLNDSFWSKLQSIIPSNWQVEEHYNTVKSNLTSLIANRNYFKKELNRILS